MVACPKELFQCLLDLCAAPPFILAFKVRKE